MKNTPEIKRPGSVVQPSGSRVRVVVEVMPKPEILDPQGKAVRGALARLGFDAVREVRQGKRFEIDVDGVVDAAVLAQIHTMAETLLANPVIEDFAVRTEQPDPDASPADVFPADPHPADTHAPDTHPADTHAEGDR